MSDVRRRNAALQRGDPGRGDGPGDGQATPRRDPPRRWLRVKPSIRLRMASRAARTEAVAAELCAGLYRRGKVGGHYAIEMEDLQEATGLNRARLQRALDFAGERSWLGRSGRQLVLKAAGIHVAKKILHLAR